MANLDEKQITTVNPKKKTTNSGMLMQKGTLRTEVVVNAQQSQHNKNIERKEEVERQEK